MNISIYATFLAHNDPEASFVIAIRFLEKRRC